MGAASTAKKSIFHLSLLALLRVNGKVGRSSLHLRFYSLGNCQSIARFHVDKHLSLIFMFFIIALLIDIQMKKIA